LKDAINREPNEGKGERERKRKKERGRGEREREGGRSVVRNLIL
jgi:hypothetical protein